MLFNCCALPRICHHLPAGRGGRHRPDGARHPRRHSPIASASVMHHMTAIHIQTERKRQDRSARCAEKHRRRASTLRIHGPIRPAPEACTVADAAQDKKRLSSGRSQGKFLLQEAAHLGNVGSTLIIGLVAVRGVFHGSPRGCRLAAGR